MKIKRILEKDFGKGIVGIHEDQKDLGKGSWKRRNSRNT
jgi:hypothetical protein